MEDHEFLAKRHNSVGHNMINEVHPEVWYIDPIGEYKKGVLLHSNAYEYLSSRSTTNTVHSGMQYFCVIQDRVGDIGCTNFDTVIKREDIEILEVMKS